MIINYDVVSIKKEKQQIRNMIQMRIASIQYKRFIYDHIICQNIKRVLLWKEIRYVFGYIPYSDEVNISFFLQYARDCNKVVFSAQQRATPAVYFTNDGGREIKLHNYDPRHTLVIVPSRACTCKGVRLGRGMGAYDRLHNENPQYFFLSPIYEVQLLDNLPNSPYDSYIQSVVIEKNIFTSKENL